MKKIILLLSAVMLFGCAGKKVNNKEWIECDYSADNFSYIIDTCAYQKIEATDIVYKTSEKKQSIVIKKVA